MYLRACIRKIKLKAEKTMIFHKSYLDRNLGVKCLSNKRKVGNPIQRMLQWKTKFPHGMCNTTRSSSLKELQIKRPLLPTEMKIWYLAQRELSLRLIWACSCSLRERGKLRERLRRLDLSQRTNRKLETFKLTLWLQILIVNISLNQSNILLNTLTFLITLLARVHSLRLKQCGGVPLAKLTIILMNDAECVLKNCSISKMCIIFQ